MRGHHGSSSPPTASSRSIPSAAGPGLLRLVSALRRRRLHPRPLRSPSVPSTRRLPRPLVRGVVSITVSLPRALLHESHPGVVSSDPEFVSLDFICVRDPGSSPSACVTSPSSWPDSPRSLPVSSDSVGVVSLSGVVPLV